MKLLILSFHFYPDLCAGSFRSTALVEQLKKHKLPDVAIDVITTLPNRYASYHIEAETIETEDGITIYRVPLPKHQSGMIDQAMAFVSFAKAVRRLVATQDYALVYATSSRLMAAALGAWVARRQHAYLYLDIRDIFVDTITEVFPPLFSIVTKPCFSLLERWTFSRADRINLVSKGFYAYVKARYPQKTLDWFTNGIDDDFILPRQEVNETCHNAENSSAKSITIVYAGNIGEGQGLHRIIPALAKRLETQVFFRLIGDGGRRLQLEQALQTMQCTNVELLSPMSRKDLIREYANADILFLHLNDYDAFRKVLPSKIFEYAAMGKPILAGIAGYSAQFVTEEISNAAIFEPCDVEGALEQLSTLELKTQERETFIQKYKRCNIMRLMATEILWLFNQQRVADKL